MHTEEESALIHFTTQWDEAMVRNNAGEIATYMCEDWVLIGSDGITSKASFLQGIESGILTHNRMDADELIVRIYGNTGVIISRGTSAGTYNGQPFSMYEWSTSMFIKNEEGWLCYLTMLTPAINA